MHRNIVKKHGQWSVQTFKDPTVLTIFVVQLSLGLAPNTHSGIYNYTNGIMLDE